MLMMVGMASDPISLGTGAVVINVNLSYVLIAFRSIFCKSRKK